MNGIEVLLDGLSRVQENVHAAVIGLSADQLAERLDADANTIAWLVWHLTRVQDDHVAEVAGVQQAYTAGGWAERFALPFEDTATGYGFSTEDVGKTRITDPRLLADYHADVHRRTAH